MKKIIIGIVVLVVIIILVIAFGSTKSVTAPITTTVTTPITTDQNIETVITYTDEGFSPVSVTVKQGETVTFENKSSNSFWPASNDHPSHLIYPEFDPKKKIPAGESYTFTFDKIGTWGYHNHIKASQKGTIIVE